MIVGADPCVRPQRAHTQVRPYKKLFLEIAIIYVRAKVKKAGGIIPSCRQTGINIVGA